MSVTSVLGAAVQNVNHPARTDGGPGGLLWIWVVIAAVIILLVIWALASSYDRRRGGPRNPTTTGGV